MNKSTHTAREWGRERERHLVDPSKLFLFKKDRKVSSCCRWQRKQTFTLVLVQTERLLTIEVGSLEGQRKQNVLCRFYSCWKRKIWLFFVSKNYFLQHSRLFSHQNRLDHWKMWKVFAFKWNASEKIFKRWKKKIVHAPSRELYEFNRHFGFIVSQSRS